jgi:hypothetical protein
MPNVNHRFNVSQWRLEGAWEDWWKVEKIDVGQEIDA